MQAHNSRAMGMGLKRGNNSLLLLILLASVGASAASFTVEKEKVSCNGTLGLGDCFSFSGNRDEFGVELTQGGDELLRHYAAGARWLLQSQSKTATRTLQKPPVCSTPKYSNCIPDNPGASPRPCADYNHCKRANGNG